MSKINAKRFALLPGRWKEIAEGTFDVTELDDEEIFSGRLRQANGVLGPRPSLLPQQFIDEQQRRLLNWSAQHVRENLRAVLQTITEIATDPNNSPADRLKAAFWIAERFMGKVPERLMIAAEDPVEALFRSILEDPAGLQAAPHEPSAIERGQ